MPTTYSATARAGATVANQPSYDIGGFAVAVREVLAGPVDAWETLHDTVTVSFTPADTDSITLMNIITEPTSQQLPLESENHTAGRLVAQVLAAARRSGSTTPWQVQVVCTKGISIRGTGLGSSGAGPAAALHACEECFRQMGTPLHLDDTHKAHMLVRSDFGVPDNCIPAYFGGMQRMLVSGEDVVFHPIPIAPDFGSFVLVTPRGFGIDTQAARRLLAGAQPPDNHLDLVDAMLEAAERGDSVAYGRSMEEAHAWFVGRRRSLYPEDGAVYTRITDAARAAGALGSTISGAGPTLFSLAPSDAVARAIGQAVVATYAAAGYESTARLVGINTTGAELISPAVL